MHYTFQRTWHIVALSHLQPKKTTRGQTLHASTVWRAFPFPGRRPTTQPEKSQPQSCTNSSHGQHLPTTRSSFFPYTSYTSFRYTLDTVLMFICLMMLTCLDSVLSLCQIGVAGLHCWRADDAQLASFAQTVEHAVVGYLFLKTAPHISMS